MRGLAGIPILMVFAGAIAVAPTTAASPSGGDPARELVVAVRMEASCPSVLGCPVDIHLVWPGGTIQEPASLDGADAAAAAVETTETRFAVPAGPVRVDVIARMITARTIDGDMIAATTEDLTACSLELVVPQRLGSTSVTGTVVYDRPPVSPGTMVSPRTPDWSCDLAVPTADRGGGGPGTDRPAVIPIQATVCEQTGRRTADDCRTAIRAAASLRLALRQATVAIAVPDCPDTASCPFPTYAVAFSSHEGDAWPWSETLLVSLDPAGATVVPWSSSQTPPPARLAATQESLARIVGGRLGAAISIPTSLPVPEGSEAVCLTAVTGGTLTRHPSLGVVLAHEEGFTRVTWPAGWTAREAPEGFVLVDAAGETVAREGQVVRVGGGETAPGEWVTCGEISLPFLM